MKIIVALAVGFFGLVPSVFAASSAQDGSKMKLGDPIPAVTVPNQDGKPVNLAEEGKTGLHTRLLLSEGNEQRLYCSGLQPPRFLHGVATKGGENLRGQR